MRSIPHCFYFSTSSFDNCLFTACHCSLTWWTSFRFKQEIKQLLLLKNKCVINGLPTLNTGRSRKKKKIFPTMTFCKPLFIINSIQTWTLYSRCLGSTLNKKHHKREKISMLVPETETPLYLLSLHWMGFNLSEVPISKMENVTEILNLTKSNIRLLCSSKEMIQVRKF